VNNFIQNDTRKSIHEISVEGGISAGSVFSILHKDLNMHYLCQHSIPEMLTSEHKESNMTLAKHDVMALAHSPYSSDLKPPNALVSVTKRLSRNA
jgi:hypothetical protein